ncbi:MAG: serine/threonine-protein kinase [Myxococcota bacterium]
MESLPYSFGQYRLIKSIGSGGMAEVFLATEGGLAGFERELCIKRVRPEFANDEVFVRLLIDEAKLISGLSHPNIAQAFDLGQHEGLYYIAMEYVEGLDVLELLRLAGDSEINLPVGAAVLIAISVGRALHAAHTHKNALGEPQDIVHRDVSPQNVLIDKSGNVKLIDFGVAKARTRVQQTTAGVIKGKYNYLAPEQASGQKVDARTDIFALGILLYEMLAGQPLYGGTHIAQLLDQARKAKVPALKKTRSDVPSKLEKIVKRALKRSPSDRYQSAGEMVEALEEFSSKHSGDAAYRGRELAQLVDWMREQTGETQPEPEPAPANPFDPEATQVADPKDIASRRKARKSGINVQPVPIPAPKVNEPLDVIGPPPTGGFDLPPAGTPGLSPAPSSEESGLSGATIAMVALLLIAAILGGALYALW